MTILTGKRRGQDFIVSFVVWTLSRMHVSFHWQRTRLYLDNELLLFFGKTCTDERCKVNKLSELSFLLSLLCSLKHVAPLTGSLEWIFISTHQHSFSNSPSASSSQDLHQSWEGRGESSNSRPKRACQSVCLFISRFLLT